MSQAPAPGPGAADRCSICLEEFGVYGHALPRMLPTCLHTFCQGCLQELRARSGDALPCPICRQLNPVDPWTGVGALPINSRVWGGRQGDMGPLAFVDPEDPACPACGALTLYAPFGPGAGVAQCHTCEGVIEQPWLEEELPSRTAVWTTPPTSMETVSAAAYRNRTGPVATPTRPSLLQRFFRFIWKLLFR
ncbi:E3 ubiquitin-protein ligase TRIM56-like [Lepisosteus oculatus]|uniref:E3 ubiquitin-protein ligase TRIM56-like n=1 Tax=Lepisosteus oculatus TaxID=7918 RepID=UPI00073FD00E|nr:PREDICTED: E3 ubiquitin-protein ligase TRIM56-like [Lepisosteus oculatus]XP_015222306.1 PREDICTED: E3 ubiquitin-protein ligase TRIM56-like [Lepisosteus oculatus]XP_015222307.1 PREDICTED: E3 ubiquitin-protein ligase TRIM56-like [Lepisosteus oculatus]XP_015222308.1 PREDICTED: E3 ubiquitin-protein ligase TRIM56-like [Lepisosteus oculatus]